MKITGLILFFFMLSMPAMAEEKMPPAQDRDSPDTAELRQHLNSFAALGEGHVENVLQGLRRISATEQARSGEWEKMRETLAEFGRSGIKAAAVWFVRPDGSYYTVEKGLTDQNISDRTYFKRLMTGDETAGELLISRSTGKRTAVVAVPVKGDGKIIGGLGASLAVEEISRMLDEKMGLPGNMFFYALDPEGRTALHRTSALLLAYPSDMGSMTMATKVGEMLAKPEGVVTYDFYGERSVVFKKFPLTGWVFAVGVPTGRRGPGTELPPSVSELEKEILAELGKMDRDLAGLAKRLSGMDYKTQETRTLLGDLCRSYPYAVDCAVVDRNGRMVKVAPEAYTGFEGSDIGSQEQIIRLHKTKRPVMSMVISTVEGIDAVDIEYPIFSPRGEFAGSVSILIRPEALFSHILVPVLRGMPVEAFVMQTDGRIIYDADKEEIGRMLFEDPVYKPFPQLVAVGTMAARERSGAGSYEFKQEGSEKLVKKDAYWTTVGLYGTEWRLVVMHVRAGHAASPGEDAAKPGTVLHDALRTLAQSAEMKKALSGNDDMRVRDILRDFYSKHEGLYSVQWLDVHGINRYGYPEENSLIKFDMKTLRTASSKPMLEALASRKESTFDSPLVEGKTGTFFMVPAYEGTDYLGMIYTIRIKK